MPTRPANEEPTPAAFDVETFLRAGGAGTSVVGLEPGQAIFSQGEESDSVLYLQGGVVKLTVLSRDGQEAVVAMLEAGAFFGESALTDDPVRHESASAVTTATVLVIPKAQMVALLHEQRALWDRFMAYLLARNIRLEEDVVDQLFNSSDKRLARALLLLARCRTPGKPRGVLPPLTQQTLADMVGTTRSRVNFFMNRFKKLGYIEYRDGLKVNDSLARVVMRDRRAGPHLSNTG